MNLKPLYEEAIQFNNFNGTVLAAGKVEVWYLGRTRKADIYADVAGETPLPNPFDLNNLGMQQVYVNPAFNYTLVVYDPYGSELFSIDKYLQGVGVHTTSDVVVQPSENIGVSAWTVGEVQIYQPYLIGDVGKTYEGISPIVVNNDEDKISANHVALGLQEPLFFVQDDESACIIGCSAQTEIPSSVSSKWEDASDTVSTNSAQWGIGTVYTAGNYIDIDNDVISVTGLQVAGDYAYNSALSSKLDTTAFSTVSGNFLTAVDLTPYQEKTAMSGYLTTGDSAQFYTNDNPSGFITGVDLSNYATTGDLANKLDTTAFSDVSGDFITALPEDLVYTGDLNDYAKKDFVLSSIDSSTSGLLPTSSFSSVSGSFLTALPSDLVYTADIADMATTGDLTGKQDITGMTAYATVESLTAKQDAGDYLSASDSANFLLTSDSGNFYPMNENPSGYLTAHQDLSDYQTTAGMTAYQPAGDYLTTADSAQFITALPADLVYTADIQDMATTGDLTGYLTTADSANFYTTANESGFITGIDLTPYATTAEVDTLSSMLSGAVDYVSANAGGVISSYTSAWSPNVPPYGGYVINSLNGKDLSAFVSNSAQSANFALGANTANTAAYAQNVNTANLVSQGFVRNLSSEYGTISVSYNHLIESTNSAVSRTGHEGFVSSFSNETVGPQGTATFSWGESLPETKFNFTTNYPPGGTIVSYSANTNLTGEVAPSPYEPTTFSIDVPNATAISLWSNNWVSLKDNVASAAETFETTVGELAWASALPTYEYDSSNKISAINGSALAGGSEFPQSATKAIETVTANSATWNSVTSKLETTAFSDVSGNFITAVPTGTMNESAFGYDAYNNITAYNGSAFKAGDEFPQSATEAITVVTSNSATWNETTDTVSSNSGVWGGSALPISAGPGIKVSLQNNTLVFENDETLLYSTSSPANTISLSEASTGFEKLRLELSSYQSREIVNYTEVKPNDSYLTYFANALIPAATYPLQIAGIQFTANNAKDYTMTTGVRMCYKVNGTYGDQYTTISTTNIRDVGFITKIWGINRIAGGN